MNPELKKLLEDVKEYIEDTEVTLDGEYGGGLSLEDLIFNNRMPEIYSRVIAALTHE